MQLVQVVVVGRLKEPPSKMVVIRVDTSLRLKIPVVDWILFNVSVTHEVPLLVLKERYKRLQKY